VTLLCGRPHADPSHSANTLRLSTGTLLPLGFRIYCGACTTRCARLAELRKEGLKTVVEVLLLALLVRFTSITTGAA
jgi:hypothetical protein